MERRSALKNMGMAFGYVVATPTLLGILQSCEKKPDYAEWMPSFFEKDKGYALAQTVDIILPKTDTPSATEINVHVFIDAFVNEVLPGEQQDFIKMKMDAFFQKVLENSGKDDLMEVTAEDIEPTLKNYLRKLSDEEEESHSESINSYMEAVMQGGEASLDADIASFSFASDIRDISIWAYKSSEYIGEQVLAYSPIPGEYIACDDVNTLTGGMDWSPFY